MPVKTKAPVLSVHELAFSFGQRPILEHITFAVQPGDYLGIVGPNGGGKTTLLKLMLGLLRPDSGEIKLFDQPIRSSSNRAKIGYVPQRAGADEHLFPATVEEIIMSGRTAGRGLLSARSKADYAAVKRAMKTADVAQLAHRRIGTLSGGERQRVMIARALAGEPAVLMLDEPTSAVDAPSQEAFYAFLRKLHTQGLTIIIVSHDLDIVTHQVDTILCLNKHLICHGPADKVMHKLKIMHQH